MTSRSARTPAGAWLPSLLPAGQTLTGGMSSPRSSGAPASGAASQNRRSGVHPTVTGC